MVAISIVICPKGGLGQEPIAWMQSGSRLQWCWWSSGCGDTGGGTAGGGEAVGRGTVGAAAGNGVRDRPPR
eukprot:12595775-Ditylum_brightwellii.AAC.1